MILAIVWNCLTNKHKNPVFKLFGKISCLKIYHLYGKVTY